MCYISLKAAEQNKEFVMLLDIKIPQGTEKTDIDQVIEHLNGGLMEQMIGKVEKQRKASRANGFVRVPHIVRKKVHAELIELA